MAHTPLINIVDGLQNGTPVSRASESSVGRVIGALAILLAFLMPFDLPVSQALSGIVGRVIGPSYLLLLPTSLLAIGSIIFLRRFRFSVSLLCWLLSGVATIVISLAFATYPSLGLFDGWLGYVSPVLVVAAYAAASPEYRVSCLRGFVLGVLVAWLVGLLMLAWSWHIAMGVASPWASANFSAQVLTWHSAMGQLNTPYVQWMGNANKASDVMLLIMLLLPVLASRTGRPIGRWFVYGIIMIMIIGIVHLVAMGSRLTLFFLPIVLILMAWRYSGGLSHRKWLMVLMMGALVATAQASGLVDRVIFNRGGVLMVEPPPPPAPKPAPKVEPPPPPAPKPAPLVTAVEPIFGSFVSEGGRIDQWRDIFGSWLAEPVDAIRGIGVGEYGLKHRGYPEAGTHNFFLDRMFEGGLIAAALAAAAVAFGIWQTIRLPRSIRWHMMLGISFLVLVMMREFSPAYLFRTSLSGVLACFLISPRSVLSFPVAGFSSGRAAVPQADRRP